MTEQVGLSSQRHSGFLAVAATWLIMGSASLNTVQAGDWPQWRGPRRDAVSTETGLLRSWTDRPRLLWRASGLGAGYSSVVISNGLVFTMGKHGSEVFLFALEAETGQPRWTRGIGTTSRMPCSTPTVDEDRIYALDPDGDLVCLEAANGSIIWQRSFLEDYGGKMMSGRGYGESPLIDGDRLLCTPGGGDAMLVALDKRSGEVAWKTKVPDLGPAGSDGAGFSSIVMTEAAGIRQYIQLIGRGLIGVDARDGRFLWGYNALANATANIPTPIVRGDLVFAANGFHAGSVLLKLVPDGKDGVVARKMYALRGGRFQNHHGGVVLVGDFVYGGHGSNNGLPTCVDLATGKVVWKRRGPGTGSAAVVYADGHLYFRYQDGVVALIEAVADEYRLKGTFQIPTAGGDSWAHPVVSNGRLYLREKDHLLVYDVKGGETDSELTEGHNPPSDSDRLTIQLRKFDVSVEVLSPGSKVESSWIQRLDRDFFQDGDAVSQTVVVTVTDRSLSKTDTIPGPLLEHLETLPKHLVLDLAGTRVSDEGLNQVANLPNLVALNLELCANVTDLGLEGLEQAVGLRVLFLTGTAVTDAGLEHLVSMKELVALDLEVCDAVTDVGCAALGSLKSLIALNLKKTGFETDRISDVGLKHLSELSGLERLNLYGNRITDAGLAHLGFMKRLRELDLSLLPITDKGLAHLATLQCLENLEMLYSEGFAGPLITDKGLEPLRELTRLKSVNLIGARVTDAGLDRLSILKELRSLRLVNTEVSEAGLDRFQSILPDCKITR